MALPSLSDFDPNTGRFTNVSPVIRIPQNRTTSSSSSYSGTSTTTRRRGLWTRFNEAVADIGNWFADHVETAISACSFITIVGLVILALVYVISTWISEGFIWAIVVAVICCAVGYYALGISWLVIQFIVNIIMYGLRILFWNGWTLLIALTIFAISLFVQYVPELTFDSKQATEYTMSEPEPTQLYRCTARVLNIRKEPTTGSNVLGTLKSGQTVEVYGVEDGFARVLCNGQYGYASLEYLRPVAVTE